MLGSATAAADGGPDLAAIDRYVRSEMEVQRIPGLALGIVHRDRIVHVQGFGEAEESGPEVTPQTPFLIGSVTKSFTALAIMQLSEADRVQLVEGDGQRVRDPVGTRTTPPSRTGSGRCATPISPSRWARPGSTATPIIGRSA
jgi:Beta-lactamase